MASSKNSPLIVANWKMNGFKQEAFDILKQISNFSGNQKNLSEIVICPPFTLLFPLAEIIQAGSLRLGAQDCSCRKIGAFTGDISAEMLKDAGAEYVILGHSERRLFHNEQNELVRDKVVCAHEAGLKAIVCVGETLDEKNQGRALEAVGEQLMASLPKTITEENTIIAYEPVWSIGSGLVPTDLDIAQMHELIARVTGKDIKILYGGSVKGDNAAELLKIKGVSGLLVGGASLKPQEFWRIINSANVSV